MNVAGEVRSKEQDMKEDLRDGDKNAYMRNARIATGVAVAIIRSHQLPQDPTSLAFFHLFLLILAHSVCSSNFLKGWFLPHE